MLSPRLSDIEEMLVEKGTLLERLRRKDLDFGKTYRYNDLLAIFEDVCGDVEEHLGRTPKEQCECEYNDGCPMPNIYSDRTVIVERLPRAVLIPTLAHEYTHHIQYESMHRVFNNPANREGHARTVERHIAQKYARRERNPAFLYQVTREDVAELKSVYLWLCDNPNPALMRFRSALDVIENNARKERKMPSDHALGNTFYILKG
jgi:hypothetical protein